MCFRSFFDIHFYLSICICFRSRTVHLRPRAVMDSLAFPALDINGNALENSCKNVDSEIKRKIWTISSPILLVFGTVGNTLSIITFSRKELRKNTSALYFIVLAIADLLSLYLGLLRYYIRELIFIDIREKNEVVCKVHVFLVGFIRHFSAWILVTVTIERFIAVWYPFKAKTICTMRNGAIALAVLGVLVFSANAHSLWTMEFVPEFNTTDSFQCRKGRYKGIKFFNLNIWPWIDSFLASYCPFAIMLVFNILIIIRLTQSHWYRKQGLRTRSHSNVKMTSMTAMLLVVTFAFFMLTTPATVYFIGQYTWWKEEKLKYPERFEVFWAATNILKYLNSAINFPLYCICGPKFRRELTEMFTNRACRNRVSS